MSEEKTQEEFDFPNLDDAESSEVEATLPADSFSEADAKPEEEH